MCDTQYVPHQRKRAAAVELAAGVSQRLRPLVDLGLGYLSLSRTTPTLSGGELQRLRLATQLSSDLFGVVYILDEPSAGLHPQDVAALLGILDGLRGGRGNSLFIVEHSVAVIWHADWLVGIGRTPRSNVATYTGLFDHVRRRFADTPEARLRGYKPGRFSFNVTGGHCPTCEGEESVMIELLFLPSACTECPDCHGTRYKASTLEVI